MAQINVPVNPAEPPSYLGLSRPISDMKGSSAIGELIKGVGNVVESGIKAVDFTNQQTIDNRVRNDVDQAQNALVEDLETTMLKGGQKTNLPLNILPYAEESAVPPELEGLESQAGGLQTAINGGKESAHTSLFKARMHHLAKSLRTEYPGYRKFIDDTIQDATKNPTNEYIRSLTALINQNQTSDRAIRMRTLSEIDKLNGAPNYDKARLNLINGGSIADATQWIQQTSQSEWYVKTLQRNKTAADLSRDQVQKEEGDKFTLWAGTVVSNDLDMVAKDLGINSWGELNKFIQQQTQGGMVNKTELIQSVLARLAAAKTNISTYMDKNVNEVVDGSSISMRMGGAVEYEKQKAAAIKRYEDIMKYIQADAFDLAGYTERLNKAISADTKNNIFNDKDVGLIYRAHQGLAGHSTGMADHFFRNQMLHNQKVIQKNQDWVSGFNSVVAAQPDLSQGQIRTIQDNVKAARERGITDVRTYEGFLDVVNTLTDPEMSDVIKRNVALGAFSEGNKGITSNFSVSGTVIDPVTGKTRSTPAKYNLFVKFTSEDFTKEIARLNSIFPEANLAKSYLDWAKHEFGVELFRRDIKELLNIPDRSGVMLGWDTDNQKLVVALSPQGQKLIDRGSGSAEFVRDYEKRANAIANRVNFGLERMSNIAKAGNLNIESFLLEQLVAVEPGIVRTVQGLPGQLGRALIRERLLERQKEEEAKSAKKAEPVKGF